jgi:transforming growth factor-beta-induced protein
MNMYRTMLTAIAALAVATAGALASPAYYTILHALDQDTMEVFKEGGSGTLSVSKDGGETYKKISGFKFDAYGRGVARVYDLNRVEADAPVKLVASFNESDQGQPIDTIVETTAGEFLDSLSPYKRWSWLTYAPVYVSYESLPSIVDIAVNDGRFTKLVAAVSQQGLADTLSNDGPFTVFAPTDDAFAALGLTDEQLLGLPNLTEILLYHVLPAALNGDAVAAASHLETLLGKDVDIEVIGDDLFINNSKVILGNIEASNGIIHVIDAVLLPPTLPNIVEIAVNDGRFETLVAALVETGLDAALTNEGPFTVFAPTDDAFVKLGIPVADLLANPNLANILLYHVAGEKLKAENVITKDRIATLLGEDLKVNVTEEGVFINDSQVIITDIKAENGIIHVIDTVLIPEEMPDIVDVAVAAEQFNTLVGALQATGLDEVLRGDGPFTVFAPTDEAFETLPSWLLNFLVNNPKYLEQVLLYHVASGDLNAGEVLGSRSLKTVNGRSVYPRLRGDQVYINNAKVIAADIEAENGTIHVIDKVLIPWYRY